MNEPDIYITRKHGKLFTTSLDVAEKFGKQHKNVLRAIIGIDCSEEFSRRNFEPRDYTDDRGKQQPMFLMTRDGFSFLAMGFTGKRAARWKEQYIKAFSLMEQALLNQQNLSWQQARSQGKLARREETDVVAAFVEYAKRQGSKNAGHYFSIVTNMTYKALFLVSKAAPKPFRDLLDSLQLIYLAAAESIVQQALEDGMEQRMNYRDIYPLSRLRVEAYAATLPRKRLSVVSSQQAFLRLHQQAA